MLRPRLMSLLGLSDAVFDQADLFACWRAFFESLCEDGSSLTLIVEDLQWADDGLLRLSRPAAGREQRADHGHSVGAARGDQRRPGIGAGRRSNDACFSSHSTKPAMERLSRRPGRRPAAEPARRTRGVVRTGVPLYAVETVRALIDRDVVVPLERPVRRRPGSRRRSGPLGARTTGQPAGAAGGPPRRIAGRGAARRPGRERARPVIHQGRNRVTHAPRSRPRRSARQACGTRKSSSSTTTLGRLSAVSTDSSRHCCVRAPTTRCRVGIATPGTWP